MSNLYLTNECKLLFAKTLHDIAAPLGALTLCIDDIKKALPETSDLIETSIETLSQRISYWRLMVTGGDKSPTYSDAANAVRSMAKLKSVNVEFLSAEDYQGAYVRLILSLVMLGLESLPRGGKISIDADNGIVKASGTKCYITAELKEAVTGNVDAPSSRHVLGLLIHDLAKSCGVLVKLEHEPTELVFTLKN